MGKWLSLTWCCLSAVWKHWKIHSFVHFRGLDLRGMDADVERARDSRTEGSHLALWWISGRGQLRTPCRLQQGATPGHRANCFNRKQFLSKYCVSVACTCASPPNALTVVTLYGCVDAEDVAAAVSGMDAVMGCWFSSDMMDAAHYAAHRTLLVQQTTLLTYHPDVCL